eukprot:CAMPEP_0174254112 /NCGR_PEP_ID=MMETSP0439-20130205/3464_1 /TAXON_ID=0 /ORGANISM="Stereomyxa ramosa, Strain Chinc5" /LENGTH=392 /DNA_ID=CAMNT_0015335529 /DNA_START=378 /DNA_END=1556 /DNA_ORIENTATION=+
MGDGIFVVNGKSWKHQRMTAKPLFRRNQLRDMLPVFLEHSETVLNILHNAEKKSQDLDVQNLFMRFTLDSIGKIGFGYDIRSLAEPVPFSAAFDSVQEELDSRKNPLRMLLEPKIFKENLKIVDNFAYTIIENRRVEDPATVKSKTDLLSRFITTIQEDSGTIFTNKYLRDILLNFVIAGRDTTAILLTWTCYLLSQHPNVEKKLVQEINEEIGEDGLPDSLEKLDALVYMQAVLDETLRLYPPVPTNFKQATEADVLPNGCAVYPGMWIQFSAYTTHRMKDFWGEDAESFVPERWLAKDFKKNLKSCQFMPFLGGPRICLGEKMATYEAKLLLTRILQRFSLSLCPGHPVSHRLALVMPAKYGMKMNVSTRKPSMKFTKSMQPTEKVEMMV